MHIQCAAAHGGEERLGDAVAVCGPDQDLRPKCQDRGQLLLVETRRLPYGKAHRARRDLHRGLAQYAARRGTIRLRHDSRDLNDPALAKTIKRLERAHREIWGAEEERPLC